MDHDKIIEVPELNEQNIEALEIIEDILEEIIETITQAQEFSQEIIEIEENDEVREEITQEIGQEIIEIEENDEVREAITEEIAPQKKGGLITMPFIFAIDASVKFAILVLNVNVISHLIKQLQMPYTKAVNTVNIFNILTSLTPLLGGFVADAGVGRFWTIIISSIIYLMGTICLISSSTLPRLRPPPCEGKGEQVCQLATIYISLLLTALGSGGIRACVVPFGADQLEEINPQENTKMRNFFNWYYFFMGLPTMLAIIEAVYVQHNFGWAWGFGVPTIAVLLSVIAFISGYPLYRKVDPVGSPYARFLKVSFAALRKRSLTMVSNPRGLYENEELDASIAGNRRLLHTDHMQFLDKAATVTEEDNLQSPNLWRLNTIHRVEELKTFIRMGPIWAAGIILSAAYAQQIKFSDKQALTMDRHVTRSFQIPEGSMTIFTVTSMLVTVIFYVCVFVPFIRRFTGVDRGISFLVRMGIGCFISILATLVAGFIEVKRKHATIPITVFWLMPQSALHGISEAFMLIGYLEFLYDQAPDSLRNTALGLFSIANAAGVYSSALLVSLVHKFSAGPGGSNWLPHDDDLNKGKLEYFYWLITLLQLVNLAYYIWCAMFHTFKPLRRASL